MKSVVAVIAILIILYFLQTSKRNNFTYEDENVYINPNILQKTITGIQEKRNSLYPIDTLYFNNNGSGFDGRIMFLDSENNQGVQYDVSVDYSGNILSSSTGIPSNFKNPFSGFVSKMNIGNMVNVSPKPNMQAVWDKYIV